MHASEESARSYHSQSVSTEILEELNTRVHSQIKTLLANDAASSVGHDNVDIDKLIDEIDPKLWEAITLLTHSVSERRGTSKVLKHGSSEYHIKRIRRLFLLCTLMFITDDHCSIPMHVLLADIVESQGGSALLHRILNRVGVCASADTLSRFMQHKIRTPNREADRNTDEDSFTVISADNIDFVHKYARVVKGKHTSSWHGTTVQAVQPQPSLCINSCTKPHPASRSGFPLAWRGRKGTYPKPSLRAHPASWRGFPLAWRGRTYPRPSLRAHPASRSGFPLAWRGRKGTARTYPRPSVRYSETLTTALVKIASLNSANSLQCE